MKYKECATCKYHDGKTCMFCENADMYEKIQEMSERDKAIECIKSLSRIEGYTLSYEGMKREGVLYDNIDLLMEYFDKLLKELDR